MKTTTIKTATLKAARDAALRAALRELEAECERRGIVIPEELRRAAREARFAELREPAGPRG